MRRGRFAPSPTGLMHLGNAFVALLAWLQMRSANGCFILRIEDLDHGRSRAHFAEHILCDLRWLGLDWDEGPDVGGTHAPYVQSERINRYEHAIAKLSDLGLTYPCFCSRAEIAAIASAPHGWFSDEPRYDGRCWTLSARERERRAQQKSPSLRLRVPVDTTVSFVDRVLGPQIGRPCEGGDFVVRRADGVISYQLAVVVDDAAMEVTDVLRGRDLLASTLRQGFLYEVLDQPAPTYAHVPLIIDEHGRRLAKRDGDLTLQALRSLGVAPERIVGLLAHLAGLLEGPEPLRPQALIPRFQMSRLPASDIVWTAEHQAYLQPH
ncbi:glutamyl-tRNA synthetase [Alicyclobacillus sacchari]|uniref:Glutamyl-Q tRNA(Asp) synthetase n=1 Tax=Alicyclobacillus sacchari TaxID=392010 RepID=A0A4R8LRH7_9BACL|nr:tRNA glutamyl-Q(34) synthetase GluQRS [Alicyclobacillus sacchari]TDY49692.1 glutamyl-tRNA synthetase [Alicyclobacillus sacchari]GMA58392.1 glutamyl-Q tRNA(Asp) synthetase [Alicyclobacillus sacchari]